jgi:hypothetical protein
MYRKEMNARAPCGRSGSFPGSALGNPGRRSRGAFHFRHGLLVGSLLCVPSRFVIFAAASVRRFFRFFCRMALLDDSRSFSCSLILLSSLPPDLSVSLLFPPPSLSGARGLSQTTANGAKTAASAASPAYNAVVKTAQVPGLERGMDYVKLGDSDLVVSKVCMGTMNFG